METGNVLASQFCGPGVVCFKNWFGGRPPNRKLAITKPHNLFKKTYGAPRKGAKKNLFGDDDVENKHL